MPLLHALLIEQAGGGNGAVGAPGAAQELSAWEKATRKQALDAQALAISEATQFWALACLGNMALSNDANRTAIHQLDIIPLLVNITTDASHQANAGRRQAGTSLAHQQAESRAAQAEARAGQLESVVTDTMHAARAEEREAMMQGRQPVACRATLEALECARAAASAARDEAKADVILKSRLSKSFDVLKGSYALTLSAFVCAASARVVAMLPALLPGGIQSTAS